MSRVQEFYAGRNISITGGTGFLGKILVEKLLRSCPDITEIYLLIRAKKEKSPQERIDALLADAAFEELYSPPLSYQMINKFIDDAKTNEWTDDVMENFTEEVIGKWPNTYTLTKAIAEVMNACREPIPGWLSGAVRIPGLIAATSLGIMHVMVTDGYIKLDIVPVDYVCNALISCAWQPYGILVYNHVSGNENHISLRQFNDTAHKFGILYPTNRAVHYPFIIYTKSRWLCFVLQLVFHFIQAFIIDNIARLFGKQPGLYKVARKMEDAIRVMSYFGTYQWDFRNQRIQNLWKQMEPMNRQIFPFNIQNVDWDEHSMKMIEGIRKYVLGDVDGNMKRSKQRSFHLYIVHTTVRLAFGILILWMVSKLFHGHGL